MGLREPGLPQGLCMRKSISSLSLGRPKLFAIVSQRALSIYLLLHSNWQIKSRGPFCRDHVGCVSLFLFLPFFLSVVRFSFLDLQHLLYFCLSSALLLPLSLSIPHHPVTVIASVDERMRGVWCLLADGDCCVLAAVLVAHPTGASVGLHWWGFPSFNEDYHVCVCMCVMIILLVISHFQEQ